MQRLLPCLLGLVAAGAAATQPDAGIGLDGKVLDVRFVVVDLDFESQDVAGATQDLALTETPTEIVIDLAADVLFAFDSAELAPEARETLAAAAGVVRERATGAVRIHGHTDAKGAEDYNQRLSERRAAAVRDWLIEREGLSGAGIVALGLGESEPVAPNAKPDGSDDPDGRRKNRRVEIRIQKP